jgi:hypothetical protein
MPLIERSNVVDADASVVPKLCRSEGDDGVLASVAEAMLKLARHARLSSLCRVVLAISSQVNLSRDVYIYIDADASVRGEGFIRAEAVCRSAAR